MGYPTLDAKELYSSQTSWIGVHGVHRAQRAHGKVHVVVDTATAGMQGMRALNQSDGEREGGHKSRQVKTRPSRPPDSEVQEG